MEVAVVMFWLETLHSDLPYILKIIVTFSDAGAQAETSAPSRGRDRRSGRVLPANRVASRRQGQKHPQILQRGAPCTQSPTPVR